MQNIELLKRLIEINTSVGSNNESELTQFLYEYLKPYAVKQEFVGEKRKNLISYFGDIHSKNILLLSGHMDTIGAQKELWDTPPYTLVCDDKFAYGRGTADMKGGLVICVQSIIQCVQKKILKNKLIIFVASVDEETGADSKIGMSKVVKYLLKNKIIPTGAVILEPTTYGEPPRINLGHRGLMWIKCKSYGTKMHSGLINNENNAVLNMMQFIEKLQAKITNQPHKINAIPCTSVRVTHIYSQKPNIFNIVPEKCACNLDVRISPFDNNGEIFSTISKIAKPYKIDLIIKKNTPSSYTTENQKIVVMLKDAFNVNKQNYNLGYASPTCDAHWLNKVGIPTINGLGVSGGNVHSNNEFCELQSIEERIKLFTTLIEKY